jgi:hypothetical protein
VRPELQKRCFRESPHNLDGDKRPHSSTGQALLLLALLLCVCVMSCPCMADDQAFEISPHWIRPAGTVAVKFKTPVSEGRKIFLRLAGPTVKDLAFQEVRGNVGWITVPVMRRGVYETELIDENGKSIGSGEKFKIASSEPPSISEILPRVSYARDGKYDFEIKGENLGSKEDIIVRINGIPIDFKRRLTEEQTSLGPDGGEVPYLIWNWRNLRICGFSLDTQSLYRPLTVSIEVDQLSSKENPKLILSCVQRYTPISIALGVLGFFMVLVYLFSRQKAAKYKAKDRTYTTLAYLIIDPETNTYSLSMLQLILWSAASVLAYTYLAASQFLVQWTWVLPSVPEGLPTMLGISAGTVALAVGTSDARGSKGAGPADPGFGDLITTGGVFAPERLQFFLWTVLGVFGFISATLSQDPGTVTEMAKIPDNFLPLMGVSSLGYLAGKAIRKPGPVIAELDPKLPSTSSATPPASIRVIGAHLSPRAQVRLYGEILPSEDVKPEAQQPQGAEFVSELVLTPKSVKPNVSGAVRVKVTNPDGQSAEM